MKRQIVQHFALLLVCVFTLAGCKLPSVTPPDFETIAQRQLQALEPCIGIVVVRQDVEAFKTCAFEAVRESASYELAGLIDGYVAQAQPSVKRILLAAFDVKTTKELGLLVVEWINKQLQPRSLENTLYSMLGMAQAQGLEPYEPSPQTDPYAWLRTSAGLGFAIVTITAFVRKYLPQNVDGIWVSVVAICVGLVIYYILPIIPSTLFNEIARVVLIALSGVGTVTMVDRYVKPKPPQEE